MPRGDGTGPAGQGPGTGRRAGGRGQGQGRGMGAGAGGISLYEVYEASDDHEALLGTLQDRFYNAIPEDSRPKKDQPFYHLLAENEQSFYVAYVSEQNLLPDNSGEPVDHPDVPDLFGEFEDAVREAERLPHGPPERRQHGARAPSG